MFYKIGVLKSFANSQENTCARVSFIIKLQAEACNFIKKETLAHVFSCEFCQIFKNTFFIKKHFWWLLLYYVVTWLSLDAFRTLSNIYNGTFSDNNFEFCKNTHRRCLTKMYVWYINWSYIRRLEDIQDVFWTSYVRPMYLQLCPAHVFHV